MMLRRVATAVLMLAITLLGWPPISVPMADAAMMADEQPCCPECEQGVPQTDPDCAKRPACAFPCSVAAYSLPTSGLALIQRSIGQAALLTDDRAVVPEPASPPHRPPRSSILT
jgi:hypothetical protein